MQNQSNDNKPGKNPGFGYCEGLRTNYRPKLSSVFALPFFSVFLLSKIISTVLFACLIIAMLAAYLQTGKLVTPRRSQKQWEFFMLAMFRNIISLHSKGKLGNEIFQLREEN